MKKFFIPALAWFGMLLQASPVSAVECYPEDKVKADLDAKAYTLEKSSKAEKMELFAYASAKEKRWVLFAKPEAGMVKGAAADEALLCPLDADEGDVAAMKESPYFKKFFSGEQAPAAAESSSAQP